MTGPVTSDFITSFWSSFFVSHNPQTTQHRTQQLISDNSPSLSVSPLLVSVSWQWAMCLASPLLDSDYSVDSNASTCYCLLSGDMFQGGLSCQPGLGWCSGVSWNTNASLSSVALSPPPLRPLLHLKDMLCALAHTCIFLEIKLTWASVPRTIQSDQLPTQHLFSRVCVWRRDYIALLICIVVI